MMIKSIVSRLRRDEEGASLVEYAVLLGLLLAVTAATLTGIGTDVNTIFTNVKTYTGAVAG